MLDPEMQEKKFHAAAKRKSERPDIVKVLNDLEYHKGKLTEILLNTAPPNVPVPHPEKGFKPQKHEKKKINEHSSKKNREIAKPDYKYEQVIHHLLVEACKPIFTHGMYEYVCGSVPGRGAHYGKRYIIKCLANDRKNTKYIGKFDIKHFYDSVDHEVLKKCLSKNIKDERMLWLMHLIIDQYEQGIPLGYYTSQWFANFMLQGMDHYIKEQLGIKYYIRYMDDMVIMGSNKKEIHRAKIAIEKYLNEEPHLRMKQNWQIFRFDYVKTVKNKETGESHEEKSGRPLDFMGFVFYREHVEIRKRIMLNATRKAKRISKKQKINWQDATAMLSYMGYFSHTDSYNCYLRYIKPYVNVKRFRKIVSNHQRRINNAKHNLESSRGHSAAKTG